LSDPREHRPKQVASEQLIATRPSLLRSGLLLYAAIIIAIGWAFGTWQIQVDRALTLESSNNQLTLSAVGFANHVEAMINDGVGAAMAGGNVLRQTAPRTPLNEAAMIEALGRMLTGGEYVRALFIATPTRFVAAYSRNDMQPIGSPALLSDLTQSTDDIWVGQPLNIEQGDAQVLIPIARRVPDIGGERAWAGAVLSFASLDTTYRALPVEHSGLALVHRAGVLLVRVPTLPGFKFAGTPVSTRLTDDIYANQKPGEVAIFETVDQFSGVPRQFAVRGLHNMPLRAVASRDTENSLIGWRARTQNTIGTMAIASLAIIGLTIALIIVLQRRFEALRASDERFQLVVAASNDGIWDWDIPKNYVYYSPRMKERLGFTPTDEFPPEPDTLWKLMHPDDVEATRAAVRRHMTDRVPYEVEHRVRTRSGEYRWFAARALAVWNAAGEPVRMAGAISDINEKRLAERSLHEAKERELHAREEFAQHLIQAQEQERQRLANELHDSVGQNLSLIKNRALLALQQPGLSPEVKHHVSALSELATDVIAEVRTVAQNLRPLHIEQLGLTDALETLLNKVGESSSLIIERRIESVDDVVTGAAATHLYRVAQEALNNILKHARANHCRVLLERDVNMVRLTITDNGIGFDTHANATHHGLGLASIAERVRMLSGVLHLESTPLGANRPSGTTLRIEIPIVEPPMTTTGSFAATATVRTT
jgi:two-component system sensor histidine kinase UhpB